jgi:uncharacterized protein (TIGR03790 family)
VSARTIVVCILLLLIYPYTAFALEPNEILILVNPRIETSERIAQYYCAKRKVPENNILYIHLGTKLLDRISRDQYFRELALPVERELKKRAPGEIKCLLTTYGVPIRVGQRGPIREKTARLAELKASITREKQKLKHAQESRAAENNKQPSITEKEMQLRITRMQMEADQISGNETHASVDSELSMALSEPYELYRWQINALRAGAIDFGNRTLMVSRLDGPDYVTIKALIDKAIVAESTGLKGNAYIDSRGITRKDVMGLYDMALKDLAAYLRANTEFPVKEETTHQLFGPNDCPETALYCGWYSVKKYADAFDFVDGAVGYHIASFEAQGLRDPNSPAWCSAMIRDGITATLGAVNEPYLHTIPNPRAFFPELLRGKCLVEAYYRTKPFNSWQLVLIGDPLYKPFGKKPEPK